MLSTSHNLTEQQANDLETLFKMRIVHCGYITHVEFGRCLRSEDHRQQAAVEILIGKRLHAAIVHADFLLRREIQDSYYHFDEEDEDKLPEFIRDDKPRSLVEKMDGQSEKVLDALRGGAAALGRATNCLTARRNQQIVKANIKKFAEQEDFERGDKGQGGLFGFGGGEA